MEVLSIPEWFIMEALWKRSPLVLSEIIESVGDNLSWESKTYSTYMSRLTKKGFVESKPIPGRAGKAYAFYPVVSKEACIRNESLNMNRKIKDPDAALLFLANIVNDTGLNSDSTKELLDLIDKLSKELKGQEK